MNKDNWRFQFIVNWFRNCNLNYDIGLRFLLPSMLGGGIFRDIDASALGDRPTVEGSDDGGRGLKAAVLSLGYALRWTI
jgi:hypothetical protein